MQYPWPANRWGASACIGLYVSLAPATRPHVSAHTQQRVAVAIAYSSWLIRGEIWVRRRNSATNKRHICSLAVFWIQERPATNSGSVQDTQGNTLSVATYNIISQEQILVTQQRGHCFSFDDGFPDCLQHNHRELHQDLIKLRISLMEIIR